MPEVGVAAVQVIKENRIFRRLYSKGRFQAHPLLVTYVQRNREGIIRYGISASKRIGCAVERNRAKRVIRAAFRETAGEISGGWDIVFVARSRTIHVKMNEVRDVMARQLAFLIGEGARERAAQSRKRKPLPEGKREP